MSLKNGDANCLSLCKDCLNNYIFSKACSKFLRYYCVSESGDAKCSLLCVKLRDQLNLLLVQVLSFNFFFLFGYLSNSMFYLFFWCNWHHQVMLGVDRLDMIKGIPQKILAFEKFLEENPKWRDKVVLLQIAVPTRTDVPECTITLFLNMIFTYIMCFVSRVVKLIWI